MPHLVLVLGPSVPRVPITAEAVVIVVGPSLVQVPVRIWVVIVVPTPAARLPILVSVLLPCLASFLAALAKLVRF